MRFPKDLIEMYQFPLAVSQTARSGNPTEIPRSKKLEL